MSNDHSAPYSQMEGKGKWLQYFDPASFPPEFENLKEPSRLSVAVCDSILDHWKDRHQKSEQLVIFNTLPSKPAKRKQKSMHKVPNPMSAKAKVE